MKIGYRLNNRHKELEDWRREEMVELLTVSNSLDFERIIEQELSLLAFGTPWSYPCRMQYRELLNFIRQYSGVLKIARLDVERHQKIARKCNIQTVPTLIMYSNSEEIKRTVGLQSMETLHEFVQT
jgi:thioredoxin 1